MSEPPPPPPPPPPAVPPPPPSGGSYGSSSGGSFSIGNSVSYGWNAYWKNVGPMLLIALVIIVVSVVISLIGQATGNTIISLLFSIIGWIVGLLLGFGLIHASLAVTRGEKPEVSMLFETEGFGPYIVASILFGIGFAIGLILCIIPGIIFALVFMFYGYIISENGDAIGPTDALKKASELTQGHRGELFGFVVVLILINLAGAILCGIGLLFTYGITAIAVAHTYKMLSGQAVVEPA